MIPTMLHLQLSVKFRAFGVTFGNVQRQFLVSVPLAINTVPWTQAPSSAKKLLDERGVKLVFWL